MQFWAPQYKKDIKLVVCPEEGDQDGDHGERPRGQDLEGAAEVTGFVQLGGEKAEE